MENLRLKDVALTKHLNERQFGILSQIKAHCEGIWEKDVFPHGYATIHGLPHSTSVVKILDLILKPYMSKSSAKRLSPSEVLVLLGAAFLHDVGYLPSDAGENLETVHAEHHKRGSQYVSETLGALFLDDLGKTYLEFIARLVKAHREVPERTGKYRNGIIDNDTIRVQFLVALLRLADELDVGRARATETLFEFVRKAHERPPPEHTVLQWVRHFYTTGVGVEPRLEKKIVKVTISVNTRYPEGRDDYEHYFIKPWIVQPIKRAVLETFFALAEEWILLDHKVNLTNNPGKVDPLPEDIYTKCQQRVVERESLESLIRYNHKRRYSYDGPTGHKDTTFNAEILKVINNVSYTLVNTSDDEKWLGNNGVFLNLSTEIFDPTIQSAFDEKALKQLQGFRISIKWEKKPVRVRLQPILFHSQSDDPARLSAQALRESLSKIMASSRKRWSFRNVVFCAYKIATENGVQCLHTRFIYLEPIAPGSNVLFNYSWTSNYLPWDITLVGYNLLTKGSEMKFLKFPESFVFTMSESLRLVQNGLPNGKVKTVSRWENKRFFREAQMLEAGSQIVVWWRDKRFPDASTKLYK